MLTPAQAIGLSALLRADILGIPLPRGRSTVEVGAPGNLSIHHGIAEKLVEFGYAKAVCVMPDNREVKGADLNRLKGLWSTKYRVTARGKRKWKYASVTERCGEPELHSLPNLVLK